jgi:hypothetical protein
MFSSLFGLGGEKRKYNCIFVIVLHGTNKYMWGEKNDEGTVFLGTFNASRGWKHCIS